MNKEYVDIPKPLKGFDLIQTIKILQDLEKRRLQIEKNCNDLRLTINFSNFWNLCENPIPVVFKYKNRYLITRDTNKIKEVIKLSKDEEMKFVDLATIPIKHGGRQSKDWLSILSRIPVGKAWTPKVKGIQTIREAINRLVKEKKIAKDEYEVMQRTINKDVTVYVAHNKLK